MSDLKVCRICLCNKVKLYNYNRYNLKQYYEQVMSQKVNDKDGLPHHFCYVCAAMLYKFHKFKEKCHTGQKTLMELLWSGPISLTSITQMDRQDKNLTSSIDILTASKRVKTYIVKNKSLSKSMFKKLKSVNVSKYEEIKIEDDSDNSLDKNLAEIKCEMVNIETENIHNEITKVDVENRVHEENLSDLEDDRVFSGDEDLNSENVNDVDEIIVVKEDEEGSDNCDKTTVTEEKSSHNIKEKYDDDRNINEKLKAKKRKNTKVDKVKEKARKFEVFNSVANNLHPKHWLKINLSEEEAVEEFRSRAQCTKYVSAAYKCSECFKGFSKEDMLNRHIKLRHSESLGPIVCRFCNMRFKWKCYLTRHVAQHYTKYKCLRCDLMCPLKTTALFHNEYHNGVIRKCVHCGEEFRHLSTYYTHLRTHRSEHVCTLCGASFVSKVGLNLHKRTMHINTVINPEEEGNTYCERCDIRFETRKAYEEHLFHSAMHAEGVEDLANETPAPSIPKRRRKSLRRNPRKFTACTICGKNFSTQTAFVKHHLAEHGGKPFPSKDGERHICEICGASLAVGSYASHVNTHTREKLHTCGTCGMQFNSKGSMNRHQLTHTGEKPYECTLCDKRFTQKCSMKLHYRTFHLKEPYPKRNRRKKFGNQSEAIDDYRINEEDSEENLKEHR